MAPSAHQTEVTMADKSSETKCLLERAAQGDSEGWSRLMTEHRDRLRRMIAVRLDRRLQGRIDASDVIQEAYLEAWSRLGEYLRTPTMPFFLWLRFLVGQKLITLHRRHLGVRMRDPSLEVALYGAVFPEASSAALAAQLVGKDTRPSVAAIRAEMKLHLQEALNSMEPLDREVLALRHFEQLSRAEIASLLNASEAAVSKRYIRALRRLKELLSNLPGGSAEFRL
jgi:RNA polymerase sigma-70 factor, ECF subfamily